MNTVRNILVASLVALSTGVAVPVAASPLEAPRTELAAMPAVRVVGGQVEITVPGDEARQVTVYTLTGQIVRTLTAQPGVTQIDLPAGYYIVKCDRLSQRVIVR